MRLHKSWHLSNYWIFLYGLYVEYKLFLFEHTLDIRDELGMTFSDGLFLNQFKTYKFKILPRFGSRF